MSMYDLGGGSAASEDPSQILRMYQMMHMMQNQQGQGQQTSPLGAASNNMMSALLMNPQMMKQGGTGLSNLFSGATGSMLGQYLSPYGATGAGMSPIVGVGGMMGGGV